MCGRYTLTSTDGLVEEFGLIQQPLDLQPRYNIAPTQRVPVVAHRASHERELIVMRWGLVPSWAKDLSIGNRLINARCETVAEKPAFREALLRRRCLVAANGFYEWKRAGKRKIPHYIYRRSGLLIAFAGLWERWKDPDESWLLSFTIITTAANDLMAPIHNRMPVIIERADYERWLDPHIQSHDAVVDLLTPPPVDSLEMREVSTLVNSVKNDSASCVEPAAEQRWLFD
ncbi:MAG: SOS response-associated peptidase [Proteobacteria bacterium]|nr:SOS response-associated peptidase [Pseudomonadota bacterium]